MNVAWWLRHAAQEVGDKVASIDPDDTTFSFAELDELSSRIAAVLREEVGAWADTVVMTLAPEGGLHIATMYGVMRAGGIFSALNASLLPERLAQQLKTCGAQILVASPEHTRLAQRIVALAEVDAEVLTLGRGDEGPRDLLELAQATVPDYRVTSRRGSDVAVINFTAGTSGYSKGVTMTHATLSTSAQGAMFTSGLGRETVNLSLIGMYHSGGLHDVIKLVMCGGTIVWSGGWNVDRVIKQVIRYRPNWIFFIVPTMLRDLMQRPEWRDLPIEGTGMYVAGEPVPVNVARELELRGAQFANAYGMTETMPFRITGPTFGRDGQTEVTPLGSSGMPRSEFCEVVLKDPETGEVIEGSMIEGEVCVKGDIVMPGYFGDPYRTQEAVDPDGWLHTKDVAYRDDNGWFYLRGRTDDTINSGGEKLSLLEIDGVLLAHDEVLDAACIGVSHTRFGQVPAAFVVMRGHGSRDQDADMEALNRHVTSEVERWKRPRLYVFVPEIPRTPAKRTKAFVELRAIIGGHVVEDQEGVVLFDRASEAKENPQ